MSDTNVKDDQNLTMQAMDIESQSIVNRYVAPWKFSVLDNYKGILTSVTVALAASFLSKAYHVPVMLVALLLGMSFHFLHQEGGCRSGIDFCSRTVLRTGVAFLGLRITFEQIAGLGMVPIAVVIAGVISTILAGYWLGTRLGQQRYFGVLSGGAVAICGASAALAISTTLPNYPQKERDTALTVVGVTALSTIAMVLYPLLVAMLDMNNQRAGFFLGGTIHDVAQVVGAGYMVSNETGEISTYVKLLRVAMLIPVTVAISLITKKAQGGRTSSITVPFFLLGFIALVALNSLLAIPSEVASLGSSFSNICLTTAIAALGMKTSFRDLAKVGWRPLALILTETIWIAGLVLLCVSSL